MPPIAAETRSRETLDVVGTGGDRLGTINISTTAAPAADADSQIGVLMSIDGLAAFYFYDPKAEMPTIRALATEGAHASIMKASTPTVTWPNHTTLVTGVNPAKNGVVGNNYFDRVTGRSVALIGDPEFDKEQIKLPDTGGEVLSAALLK